MSERWTLTIFTIVFFLGVCRMLGAALEAPVRDLGVVNAASDYELDESECRELVARYRR